jgi:hypothetical protein
MKRTYIAPEEHAYPPHGQTRNTTRPTARAPLTPAGADELRALMERLGKARRRRDFKTVPMILTRPEEWDHEALSEVLAYKAGPRQVWDNTEIGGPWLNLMRNQLNAQIWSFHHPDFLAVSATHGTAHLALFDQSMWEVPTHQVGRRQFPDQTSGSAFGLTAASTMNAAARSRHRRRQDLLLATKREAAIAKKSSAMSDFLTRVSWSGIGTFRRCRYRGPFGEHTVRVLPPVTNLPFTTTVANRRSGWEAAPCACLSGSLDGFLRRDCNGR